MKRRDFLLAPALVGARGLIPTADRLNIPRQEVKQSMELEQLHPVRRRFVRAQGRGVHYLRSGEGPPVVLLHAAMASALAELPLLQRLVSDHTVFAFDHPGFGDSDPLPQREIRVSDAADALNETFAALKISRCPVYGSHTGGAVAIELARRHPERVSALIVNGVTFFDAQETKFFTSEDYLPPFTVKEDGSHLFETWIKNRDGVMWFPWSKRTAKNRVSRAFPSAEGLHQSFLERLRAGAGYRDVYGAVFKLDVGEAVTALTVPATFMANAGDILFPHLDRLPKLKPNQRIARFPANQFYLDETARVLRDYRVQENAPVDAPFQPTPGVVNRRYADLANGQVLVRSAGEAGSGRPLLLLHDGRASSRMLEPLMRALANQRPVYAPDLPDNGTSDPLAAPQPGIGDYAEAVERTVEALRLKTCDVYAVGAGAAVALELLGRPSFAKARGLLEAPDFYAPPFALRLAREWVPPLTPESDGSHLNRLWLMLRDEYAFWPWFDKSPAAACAMDVPTDGTEMHARVADILRSLATYNRLTLAALQYEWSAPLREGVKRRVMLAAAENDPRRLHAEAAARAAHLADVAVLPAAANEKAREILRLLRS